MTTVRETITSSTTYPLDSRMDDVVALLHERSAGIHALDRYLQNAQDDAGLTALLRAIRSRDVASVEQLKDYLRNRLDGYDPSRIGEPW